MIAPDPVERVLSLLDGVKQNGPDKWLARCPTHEDNRPSLSVGRGDNGGAVLHCFAGCPNDAVVARLDLTLADLFPPKPQQTRPDAPRVKGRVVARYDYRDETGTLVYQIERDHNKEFWPRRPDRKGGWLNNLQGGVGRVPYRLPELLEAVKAGRVVFVVEGEKDCDSLRAVGLDATTNFGGVGGVNQWREFGPFFQGARVITLPDNDDAGRDFAQKVAGFLAGSAASVRVLDLPDLPFKGDVSDWLKAGGTADELMQLADAAPLWADAQAAKADPSAVPSLADFNPTDAGNAERLIHHRGDDLRYVRRLGWRTWNGRQWEAGEESVLRLARETMRALIGDAAMLLKQAETEPDKDARRVLVTKSEELAKHALRSEQTAKLRATVEQAKTFAEITVEPALFNLRPWIVPFANGVWDKGTWREHRRDDYAERLLPVALEPDADRSEWDALLLRITGGDEALAALLQDVAGYALSGASSLRLLPWFYGPKGTGKSTFAELLQTALGASGQALDWALVSGYKSGEELGRAVRAARAVFLPEAGKKHLDPEILKLLSGSDSLPCRELYQGESFTVPPTWALIATSNDPPDLTAYDDALKDRVKALPFLHQIAGKSPLLFTGARRLEEVRRNPESPLVRGFVAWAVEGLANVYRTQRIRSAQAAETHTRRFWLDTDLLTPFWIGMSEKALRAGMDTGALRASYLAWCTQEGIQKPLMARAWGNACRAAGLEDYRDEHARGWRIPKDGPWIYRPEEAEPPKMTDSAKMTDSGPFLVKSPIETLRGGSLPKTPLNPSFCQESVMPASSADAVDVLTSTPSQTEPPKRGKIRFDDFEEFEDDPDDLSDLTDPFAPDDDEADEADEAAPEPEGREL